MENTKLRCKMSYYRHFDGTFISGEVNVYLIMRSDYFEYYTVEFVENDKIFYCYNTNYFINGYPTMYVLSELIDTCKSLYIELCVTDL